MDENLQVYTAGEPMVNPPDASMAFYNGNPMYSQYAPDMMPLNSGGDPSSGNMGFASILQALMRMIGNQSQPQAAPAANPTANLFPPVSPAAHDKASYTMPAWMQQTVKSSSKGGGGGGGGGFDIGSMFGGI